MLGEILLAAILQLLPQALVLSGASSAEEMSEEETERFEALASDPLKINYASRSRLLSSGLLSSYQVASLLDYRTRTGDILSLAELAAVDGFGEAVAQALEPFVSFETDAAPGHSSVAGGRFRHEALMRASAKSGLGYAASYKLSAGEKWQAGAMLRSSVSSPPSGPDSWGFHAAWRGRNLSVFAGGVNARFGQGLTLWNGFSLSGVTSVASLERRGGGLSPYAGFTAAGRQGLAAELDKGRLRLSALVQPGLAALNAGWFGRRTDLGMTAMAGREYGAVSFDFRTNLHGVDLFGESSLDWKHRRIASLLGTITRLGDRFKAGALLRFYPDGFATGANAAVRGATKCSDEAGLALALDYNDRKKLTATLALDALMKPVAKKRQIKIHSSLAWQVCDPFKASLRAQLRLRDYDLPFRSDLRLDMEWKKGRMTLDSRLEWLRCRSDAGLAYFSQSWNGKIVGASLREGAFHVDNWDDRIYVYEKDAPGCFTVPARYGRGWWLSCFLSCGFSNWGKAYLRASYVSTSGLEMRLQAKFKIYARGRFGVSGQS